MKPTKAIEPRRAIWGSVLVWCVVVAAAVVLAVAAPRELGVMGRLPIEVGQKLQNKPPALAASGDERFLALVSFHGSQRKQVESWIHGLKLHQDRSIAWVRMPVANDPGDPAMREQTQHRIMARYASPQERHNLLAVVTDRSAFVEAAGLGGTDSAYALILNRKGDVLARVAGEFDEAKAQTVRDMLMMREL